MSGTTVTLILQIIAGAIGGNAAAAGMESADLGNVGNSIAGALGGVGGGTILGALAPSLEHVHVHEGGQAIVGMVEGGGSTSKKDGSTPCS
jgi:hypothetical protein